MGSGRNQEIIIGKDPIIRTMTEHQQSAQTPQPRRRLDPFLRKPLWVVLEEECDYSHHTTLAVETVDIDRSSCAAISTYGYGTSSHDDDTSSTHASGVLELPQRSKIDPTHEEDDSFEYRDRDEDNLNLDVRTEATNSTACTTQQQYQHSHRHHNHHQHHYTRPPRHLTLFDLVSIGVGGTIGSGIFVLNGLIANKYAGPATFLSWTISGFAALLSGCCYAELSGRIHSAGSSYAYAYVALGELPAFVTACMLTLEFLLSGSAVARSWGDKVVEWLRVELNVDEKVLRMLEPGYGINPAACLVSIATTVIVMTGIRESKLVTDMFTLIKLCLVAGMTIGGFVLFNSSNFKPFIPPEFGASGVLRGAVSSFFGYLGFDAVCCVAGEAINAERNLPLSIMITLLVVTTLYVTAAISLVGMQNYQDISPESGFPEAFKANNIEWASQLTAFGEVLTLPVVVLITVVIQPRLQYALANDGLLPPVFGEIDSTGNPRRGALIAGVLMTIFATFVPFSYLDDFVSAGILVAFTITNCSLIIMKRRSPESQPNLLRSLLVWFNLFAFLTCLAMSYLQAPLSWIIALFFGSLSVITATKMSNQCPPMSFGNFSDKRSQSDDDKKHFSTPFVPFIPCMGMFVNYFLISQLSFIGIAMLCVYTLFAVLVYFLYGAQNSVGRAMGWEEQRYAMLESHETKQQLVIT